MNLEVSFSSETPPTDATDEWFFPTVNHHVRLEAALAGEVLVADLALEGFLIAVGTLVSCQSFASSDLQAANGALMAERFVVSLLVSLER